MKTNTTLTYINPTCPAETAQGPGCDGDQVTIYSITDTTGVIVSVRQCRHCIMSRQTVMWLPGAAVALPDGQTWTTASAPAADASQPWPNTTTHPNDLAEIPVTVPTVPWASLSRSAQDRVIRHPRGAMAKPASRGVRNWHVRWWEAPYRRIIYALESGYADIVGVPTDEDYQAAVTERAQARADAVSGRWAVTETTPGRFKLRRVDSLAIVLRFDRDDVPDIVSVLNSTQEVN